ncbi:NAD(+)--rifampin ADP-ribosyltransferase [Nocardioides sp. C4-1]|uniref:NAD(+)--rifampin ADP-ribosyltransferase n=1 Tax=Nocardioides sp. C4-1 TaxID=3151851 RepID=UPI003263DA0B
MDTSEAAGERPVTVENCHEVAGPFLHGTKAVLAVGDALVPGHHSNFEQGRVMNHVYFTTLESTAAWGAQLATALAGIDPALDRGHVYVVEPQGPFEDDPNVTDKRFPGNPTRSYRTREPLVVVGEVDDWQGHPPQALQQMLDDLTRLRAEGAAVIYD